MNRRTSILAMGGLLFGAARSARGAAPSAWRITVHHTATPADRPGERVYYVEDGHVRGFAVVGRVYAANGMRCATTDRIWPAGFYVFMDATTWRWIRPIPMKGFRGFHRGGPGWRTLHVVEVGGWLDPKPKVEGGGT